MQRRSSTFAVKNNYLVVNVTQARTITKKWLKEQGLDAVVSTGLPEIDDRYHIWRVPLIQIESKTRLGEVVIDARNSLVIINKTTKPEVIESRILKKENKATLKMKEKKYLLSSLRNTIALGDSEKILEELPAESVDLVFTSPPYYNARPEYADYLTYEEYLLKLRKIIHNAHRVLADGRFFVINVSPVLIRRSSRQESSKRIAVPFDVHRLFVEEGYDFIDDIIWQKPEGAGWATGRGRRFAADRNPLQYKPVPVTEYVLVYRKHSDKLIDWHIRNHPKPELVKQSKIRDEYEKTNIWKIRPTHSKIHPAIFPTELVKKVVSYYSFKGDVVLDPFCGIGTVADVSTQLGRKFVIIDNEKEYLDYAYQKLVTKLGKDAKNIFFLHYTPTKKIPFTIKLDDYVGNEIER